MPPKRKRGRVDHAAGSSMTKAWLLSSLNEGYKGKRVLLAAKDIYTGSVPDGEEDYFFQYHIIKVNDDMETATITFDNKYVEREGRVIRNYVGSSGDEEMTDYPYKTAFKTDHNLQNHYNNIVNAEMNKKKYAALKAAEDEKRNAIEDTSDLARAFEDDAKPYDLLLAEFEECGDLQNHTTQTGKHAGTMHLKQAWKHKHSNITWTWHHKNKKAEFDTSMLWKKGREVVTKKLKGWQRIDFILRSGQKEGADSNPELAKYDRETDMPFRVKAVLAAVASKQPLSIFDNIFMHGYIHSINSKHKLPYRLERNRIVECMIDYSMLELKQILYERRDELGEAFASINIDFYTDSHRKECFGVIILDILAEMYAIKIGNKMTNLFMSRKTKARLSQDIFVSGKRCKLGSLEFPLNFERFNEPKTCANVSDWMLKSMNEAKVQSSDLSHVSADGASNAIGSANEFELITQKDRVQDMDFDTCYAHQNQRSAGRADGTLKFADNPNPTLGALIKKNHAMHVRIQRSAPRTKLLHQTQKNNGRQPILSATPAGETRWDGHVTETKRSNIFMGDFSATLEELVEDFIGLDYNLMSEQQKASGDKSDFIILNKEKEILRQYEGATVPAHRFNKFTQDKRNAFSYVLLESRIAVQDTKANSFAIHPDVSHMVSTKDLRDRGDKTVLVKSANSAVSLGNDRNYTGKS